MEIAAAIIACIIAAFTLYHMANTIYRVSKRLTFEDSIHVEPKKGYTDPLEDPEVEQALIMRKMYAELEIIIPDWHKTTQDDPPHISEATMISRQEAFQAGLNPDRDNIRKLLFFMREGMRAYAKGIQASAGKVANPKYDVEYIPGTGLVQIIEQKIASFPIYPPKTEEDRENCKLFCKSVMADLDEIGQKGKDEAQKLEDTFKVTGTPIPPEDLPK